MKKKFDDPAAYAFATFNMTPMIDVVFQLIVVFLCSMKFRTLDQKVEAVLPKDRGIDPRTTEVPEIHPVLSVRLLRKGAGEPTRIYVAGSRLGETREGEKVWTRLQDTVRGVLAKAPDLVGEIDAEPTVDHGEVVRTIDGFVAAGLTRVRFRGTTIRR